MLIEMLEVLKRTVSKIRGGVTVLAHYALSIINVGLAKANSAIRVVCSQSLTSLYHVSWYDWGEIT